MPPVRPPLVIERGGMARLDVLIKALGPQ